MKNTLAEIDHRSRSPSRYEPSSSYSSRRNRLEDTDTASSSYSSRYTPTTSRSSGAEEINRLSRNLERSVSSILSGDYRRDRENREAIDSYSDRIRNAGRDSSYSRSRDEEPATSSYRAGSSRYGEGN